MTTRMLHVFKGLAVWVVK